MSASREKKQRQNDPNQGLSQKQRKELEEQKAAKHKAILYTVIGIVVAALVVVLLVWHSGFFQSRTTAVSVGGRDYSPADVEYYYRSLVQYEYYPQSDLRTQYVDANQTQSYHDKFLQTTLETLTEVAAVENAAEAEGFTLTQEELDHVAASVNTMKENASSNGYTYATYLKAVFGPYMTPSRYETCMKRAALVNSYTTKISDSFAVSDEEILDAMRLLGRTQGIFGEPAGVTGTAGIKKALELGLIDPDSTVVSVVTGNGLKDVQNGIRAAGEPMVVKPDMDALLSAFAQRRIAP